MLEHALAAIVSMVVVTVHGHVFFPEVRDKQPLSTVSVLLRDVRHRASYGHRLESTGSSHL